MMPQAVNTAEIYDQNTDQFTLTVIMHQSQIAAKEVSP
jgi:hypothetical protein